MEIFQIFYNNKKEEQAEAMAKYMKNLFPFLGLKKPERVILSKEFLSQKKKENKIDWNFIFKCYRRPEREFQYLAVDYINEVKDLLTVRDIKNIEKLLITKSWWDSVDAINTIVGYMAMKCPEIKDNTILNWSKSDNIWLKRVSILFQLRYKESTDREFLSRVIIDNSKTDEFFINKAIGWALREYSKTNKKWVRDFINNNQLSSLSIREGSKYI